MEVKRGLRKGKIRFSPQRIYLQTHKYPAGSFYLWCARLYDIMVSVLKKNWPSNSPPNALPFHQSTVLFFFKCVHLDTLNSSHPFICLYCHSCNQYGNYDQPRCFERSFCCALSLIALIVALYYVNRPRSCRRIFVIGDAITDYWPHAILMKTEYVRMIYFYFLKTRIKWPNNLVNPIIS